MVCPFERIAPQATTLAEALRLAPGVQISRIDASQPAVGMRGFASRLSRSVLVLIDGRSVYTPLFAGTYWDVQDVLLEDIDGIEVIRGPGGTLWGANAVNGVINIITRSAKDTQGTFVEAGAGNEERVFGGVRWGGTLGPAAAVPTGCCRSSWSGSGWSRRERWAPSGPASSRPTRTPASRAARTTTP